MPAPTSYTADTFAKYIHREVLQHVADTMEWFTKTPADEATLITKTKALDYDLPIGASVISFDYPIGDDATILAQRATDTEGLIVGRDVTFAGDPQIYKIMEVASFLYPTPVGDYRFKILPYNEVAKTAGTIMTWEYNKFDNPYILENDPVYGYIMDEALISLGMTTIDEINSANIMEFRAVARIEAWRAVLSNAVAMVQSENQEGVIYSRGQVYDAALQQLQMAEQEYSVLFGAPLSATTGYATTTSTKLRGAW